MRLISQTENDARRKANPPAYLNISVVNACKSSKKAYLNSRNYAK